MIRKDNGRFLAFLMALCVILASWLGLEYLSAPSVPPQAVPAVPPRASTPRPGEPLPAPQARQPVQGSAAAPPAAAGILRCRSAGKVIYTDQHALCDKGAKVDVLDAAPTSAGIAPYRPYQDQLADLQAERRRQPAAVAPPDDAQRRARASQEALCRSLDERIRWLDSALRQPHSAWEGDRLTAERRNATNRRFEARC